MYDLKKLTSNYFKHFSNKDLDNLSELFINEISLKDWNIDISNKYNVLKSLKEIFDNVITINIIPNEYYLDGNTICCDITIIINNKDYINVLDIITYNEFGKIKKIKAFKI